jgi:hypothetical protein
MTTGCQASSQDNCGSIPRVGRDVLSEAAQRWVDEQVAKAPPLSSEQRERILALLA